MGTDERYNGWANRETWAVSLYLNNDQWLQESTYDLIRAMREGEQVEHHRDLPAWKAGEGIRDMLAELSETVIEGVADRDTRLMFMDIGSLWRVEWDHIGGAFLADVAELDAFGASS